MSDVPLPRDESPPGGLQRVDDEAAAWVARRDRGLSPAEQDAFFHWLAANPLHGERFARHRRGWEALARLSDWRPEHGAEPNADLLAPATQPRRSSSLRWLAPATLAVAASIAVTFTVWRKPSPPPLPPPLALESDGYRQQVLDDGTLVELNRGARLSPAFTPAERRVQLAQGEALFTVAKNPLRPFVVEAAGVTVRAVGTAFQVRLGATEVEILVTEGSVQVDRTGSPLATPALVEAGHRAIMPLVEAPPVTLPVTREEIDQFLAWQPRLLEFVSTPLAEVAAEFNRRNRLQMVVADPALAGLPIGASFRSDNVDGFVRLLEASFGVRAERAGETVTLHRAR